MKNPVAAHTACHDSLPTLLSRAAINELLTHRIYSLLISSPKLFLQRTSIFLFTQLTLRICLTTTTS